MAGKRNQTPDLDLDRTDKLPILEGVSFDPDVEDDAVRMDPPAAHGTIEPSMGPIGEGPPQST